MFKNHKILNVKRAASLMVSSALAAGMLAGCAPLADPELSASAGSGADQMVGIYITKEDPLLSDWYQYSDENGKLYAEMNEDAGSYDNISVFPVSGYPCYIENQIRNDGGDSYSCISTNVAEAFWDTETSTHSYSSGSDFDSALESDEYCTYSINAFFHVVPDDFWAGTEEPILYINKVYMEPDGDYYMVGGNGYYISQNEDGSCAFGTSTLSESWTPSGYGKELTSSFSFTCDYYAVPTKTTVLQYSADDQLLKTDTWAAGQAPATMNVEEATSYLIIKNIGQNMDGTESVSTSISSPELGADTTYVNDPYEAEDGTVYMNQCEVSW